MYSIETLTQSFPKAIAGSNIGPGSCTPIYVDHGEARVVAISNGHALLAIDVMSRPEGCERDTQRMVGRMATEVPAGHASHQVSLASLTAWASEAGLAFVDSPERTERCEECSGSGDVMCNYGHPHVCEGCDGRGSWLEPAGLRAGPASDYVPAVRGLLFGIPLDRRYIATVLRLVSGDEVVVYVGGRREGVHIVGRGWKAIVMPLALTAAECETVAARYP